MVIALLSLQAVCTAMQVEQLFVESIAPPAHRKKISSGARKFQLARRAPQVFFGGGGANTFLAVVAADYAKRDPVSHYKLDFSYTSWDPIPMFYEIFKNCPKLNRFTYSKTDFEPVVFALRYLHKVLKCPHVKNYYF